MHLTLQVNFVLKVWAVREAVSELCFESCSLNLSKRSYYMLTYALTAAAYLVSVFIPSGAHVDRSGAVVGCVLWLALTLQFVQYCSMDAPLAGWFYGLRDLFVYLPGPDYGTQWPDPLKCR